MGVLGLWTVLRPASQTRSLIDIAIREGFETRSSPTHKPSRGFRIGVNASIWIINAGSVGEDDELELRTLFYRCSHMLRSPMLPLFVFDGPDRPAMKRGSLINREPHKMEPNLKLILEGFGFSWITAPGEAEAELAYLNRIGIIDGIMSDDVDTLLFGAKLVIRNPSPNLTGNMNNTLPSTEHTSTYAISDIMSSPSVQLTREGLILIALLCGNDYHPGIPYCGIQSSVCLARCGFGEDLLAAFERYIGEQKKDGTELFARWLVQWRIDMATELSTNAHGFLRIERSKLSKYLSSSADFPDIPTLRLLVHPLTSQTDMRFNNRLATFLEDKDPNLVELGGLCETFFTWGTRELIIRKFRNIMWSGIVCRIIRRAVIDSDLYPVVRSDTSDRSSACEIPPHYLDMSQSMQRLPWICDPLDFITRILSERTHISTAYTLEYRIEVDPSRLVTMTEGGVKGERSIGMATLIDDGSGALGCDAIEHIAIHISRAQTNPSSHLQMWIPGCMIRRAKPKLISEYEKTSARMRPDKKKKQKGKKVTGRVSNDSFNWQKWSSKH